MKALFPKFAVLAGFLLTVFTPAQGEDLGNISSIAPSSAFSPSSRTTPARPDSGRWQGTSFRARPNTSIGVSIYSGPGPYSYRRYHDGYPYYPVYGGPVYVAPPPVVYAPPAVVVAEPPVYYGNPVPPVRYEAAPVPQPAPAIDTKLLQVQENLRRLGYYKGSVDGFNGPSTRAAIRGYQVDRGLPVTGRMDKELLQDLGL